MKISRVYHSKILDYNRAVYSVKCNAKSETGLKRCLRKEGMSTTMSDIDVDPYEPTIYKITKDGDLWLVTYDWIEDARDDS